jgi:hypothetical protein
MHPNRVLHHRDVTLTHRKGNIAAASWLSLPPNRPLSLSGDVTSLSCAPDSFPIIIYARCRGQVNRVNSFSLVTLELVTRQVPQQESVGSLLRAKQAQIAYQPSQLTALAPENTSFRTQDL